MELWCIEDNEDRPDDEGGDGFFWRADSPNLVLVAIDNGRCRLLDWCGRANEYERDHGELYEQVQTSGWNLADGVWIVPGEPDYSRDYYGEVEGGWDTTGEPRRLTDEEWALFIDNDDPWDPEWRETQPIRVECSAPIPTAGTCAEFLVNPDFGCYSRKSDPADLDRPR